jgi:hypothetical protein
MLENGESVEETVISAEEEELEDFRIGHKKESETVHIKIIDSKLGLLVDTPGSGETRGNTLEISNSLCVSQLF